MGTFAHPPDCGSAGPLVPHGGFGTEELRDPNENYITFDESGRTPYGSPIMPTAFAFR